MSKQSIIFDQIREGVPGGERERERGTKWAQGGLLSEHTGTRGQLVASAADCHECIHAPDDPLPRPPAAPAGKAASQPDKVVIVLTHILRGISETSESRFEL